MQYTALLTLAAFLVVAEESARAQSPEPQGGQFQVNSYTSSYQRAPAVALDAQGNFVVVWQSAGSGGSDGPDYSVQGRRFAADGTAAGSQFQVNIYTTNNQYQPVVAVDADGDFVVVWHSNGSAGTDTDQFSVQAQRYAADGTALGGEFQVNSYTMGHQRYPSVAINASGDFVVVWESGGSAGTDTAGDSVQGQRYAADGTAVGGEFQVNSYTPSLQYRASVAADAAGNFVVVWQSLGSDGTDTDLRSIQGQRYAADGTVLGGQFQVNTYTTSSQVLASVGVDADGDFMVAWESFGSVGGDSSSWSIQGQRYAADGTAAGGQFQVNSYTTSGQFGPAVALDAGGGFVVVWRSYGSAGTDGSGYSVQGMRFAADGSAVGGEFQVNTYTTSQQQSPGVALDAAGDFVVTWDSFGSAGSDSSGWSIQAQRYQGLTIFSDGFESGDTSAWSGSVP